MNKHQEVLNIFIKKIIKDENVLKMFWKDNGLPKTFDPDMLNDHFKKWAIDKFEISKIAKTASGL